MPLVFNGQGGESPDERVSGQHALTTQLVPRRVRGSWRSRVQLGQTRVAGQHVSTVRLGGRVAGQHTSITALRIEPTPVPMPLQMRPGVLPDIWEVSCSLGQVQSLSYEHSGIDETATLTLLNVGAPSSGSVSFIAGLRNGTSLSRTLKLDAGQYETNWTPEGSVTTVRLLNETAEKARTKRLSELLPWKLNPRGDMRNVPCAQRPKPRTITVDALLTQAAGNAGVQFVQPQRPLGAETYMEGVRDIKVQGRTFAELFNEIYSGIGYQLIVRGTILYGLGPGQSISGAASTPLPVMAHTERGERAQTPGLIRLTGGDQLAKRPPLVGFAPDAPNPELWRRAVSPNYDWITRVFTPNGETMTGKTKLNGNLVRTVEITTDRVEVKEEGETPAKVFNNVLMGYNTTEMEYDPECPDKLLWQRTVKRTYGYSAATKLKSTYIAGGLVGGGFSAGDTGDDEQEIIEYRWGEDGVQRQEIMYRQRVNSMQQAAAEGEISERGVLTSRETQAEVTNVTFDQQGGEWQRTSTTSGAVALPVYDLESQEPVRLNIKTGSTQSVTERMEGMPKTFKCTSDCPAPLAFPNQAAGTVTGGGSGITDASFPMVAREAKLQSLIPLVAKSLAPRVVHRLTVAQPVNVQPGSTTGYGICTRFSLSVQNGLGSVEVESVELKPVSTLLIDDPETPRRGMMLWHVPGGIMVGTLNTLSEGGDATFKRIFVRAGAGVNPAPGELVEFVPSPAEGILTLVGGWGG
ncbi:hypothetical protein [Deinococcus sp. QL22]|uniref:hypothetical protein n=1 Tax=Deinococcus sp. QL22 TaxID=2939437 RepID=UPI002017802A|nr:hypothetical protein [Deinococcus sp. QL22]UQN06276.1 hypothetical protein M1R55_15670 [Deinococcus sp. QL22]